MIPTSTLKIIVSALFILSLLWLIRVIVRREFDSLFRAILILAVFGACFVLLEQTKLETISFQDIKNRIFPEKTVSYTYRVNERSIDGMQFTRYLFDDPGPRLNLTLDKEGQYYHITDPSSVNRVLKFLNLPEVDSGVNELASITGKANDVSQYVWNDYPLGVLRLERGLSHGRDSIETYICISSISINRRY